MLLFLIKKEASANKLEKTKQKKRQRSKEAKQKKKEKRIEKRRQKAEQKKVKANEKKTAKERKKMEDSASKKINCEEQICETDLCQKKGTTHSNNQKYPKILKL